MEVIMFLKKSFLIVAIISLFSLFSCGGGGGGGTSTSSSASSGGGTGGTTVTATAADNVSKIEISSFNVQDECKVNVSSISYDSNNDPVSGAKIILTVSNSSSSKDYYKTTDEKGIASFSVDVCQDLTTSSVSKSVVVGNSITFEIKPDSDVAKGEKTIHIDATADKKIDVSKLIDELQLTIDNYTEDNVTLKITAKNKLPYKDVKILVDNETVATSTIDDNGSIYYTYKIPAGTFTTNITAEPVIKTKSFKANNITLSIKNGKLDTKKIITNLELFTSKLSIYANDNDTVTITAYATNKEGAVTDTNLEVSANYGDVSSDTVTLKNGFASFTFKSPYYPGIIESTITVKDKNSGISKDISIELQGIKLTVSSTKQFIKSDGNDYAVINILLTDSANNPIQSKDIQIITTDSSIILKQDNNTEKLSFNTDNITTVKTDLTGTVKLKLSSNNPGNVNITVSADKITKTLSFTITGEKFEFSKIDNKTISADNELSVGENHIIEFSWKDSSGNGVNDNLEFYTNLGVLSQYTNGNCGIDNKSSLTVPITDGVGKFCIISNNVGNGIIQAVLSNENKSTSLYFHVKSNNEPVTIILQATSTVIPVSSESSSNSVNIIAKALDKDNYPVSGKEIIFKITSSTDTGEKIFPIFATTDSSGKAFSVFTSGTSSSSQDGITIEAVYKDNESVKGTLNLTVSGEAVNISIGKGIAIQDSGETNYKKPFTVLITDSNGGPVANQKVSLSVYATKYRTADLVEHANEDINHNNILDPGEDINGNGVLDPGQIVTITPEVTTDNSGFATFYIEYAKCYSYWTDVAIKASTVVSGTESEKDYEFTLPYSKDDADSMPCQCPFE
jgi:hypothetical protein